MAPLAPPPLTSRRAARFLAGLGPVLAHGPGVGASALSAPTGHMWIVPFTLINFVKLKTQ